ncbi:MAG: hypothetical protein ACI9SJ_001134 [Flavobacteriaceae bacterium]|jgi:hypothetical protein|uniref:2TM domain-containing protein n=1 Tax=Candidatus Marifrigoribacter sp. Uisw_064 TaxID=3230970 RepID=UPI003AD85B91
MENFNKEKYDRATKKVKKIKDFYSHLTVYIVINSLLILMHLGIFQIGALNLNYIGWSMFSTPFFWGIGLFFHGLNVFQGNFSFFRNWEDKKMKEFMDQEENDKSGSNKWK